MPNEITVVTSLIDMIEEKIKHICPLGVTLDITRKNRQNINESLIFHLSALKSILMQSIKRNNADPAIINIAKIHEAIHYLETIPLKNKVQFFKKKSSTISEQLKKTKRIVLPENELNQPSLIKYGLEKFYSLSSSQEQFFIELHTTLFASFENYLSYKNTPMNQKKLSFKPAWIYSYPLENDSEVSNPSISEWQKETMEDRPGDNLNAAFEDFIRSISIKGVVGKNENDVENLLEYLFDNTIYPEEDKEMLKAWTKTKGGQIMDVITAKLLFHGELSHQSMEILKSVSIEDNWTVAEGKAIRIIDRVIYGLDFNNEYHYWSNGRLTPTVDYEPINDPASKPILRIEVKIQLDIENKQVVPKVIHLTISSHTHDLIPANRQEQRVNQHRN